MKNLGNHEPKMPGFRINSLQNGDALGPTMADTVFMETLWRGVHTR